MNDYLHSGYLCPVNKKTVQKAEDVAGEKETDRERAEALFEWVRDTYCWDMTKVGGATYLLHKEPARAMSFDKSNLLVSLLRSVEIPARFNFIKCTFQNEYKDRIDDSIHAPVEVKLDDEWITADPAFGEHTSQFKSVASFGEKTWKDLKESKKLAELPRWFVFMYNHIMRYLHPDVRKIRRELRECQNL
ncbi:MAG: transglutaminase family protein [Candidatus Nanohaloarchaea archaeon]|nr:transglutaminase family protein [Candidatus Nanohaloarchaea archaeon]